MEEFLKFGRFKRESAKIRGGHGPPCPTADANGHLLNVPQYRSIAKRAISIFLKMPTTYLCENGFSFLYEIKSRKKNLITHIDPLRTDKGAIKKDIIPRFGMLICIVHQQKSH